MSKSAQFRTRSTPSSVLHSPDLPSVACLVLGADRRSVSSVRACVSCLAWFALLPVLCSRSGCAGVQASTGGVYRERRGWDR